MTYRSPRMPWRLLASIVLYLAAASGLQAQQPPVYVADSNVSASGVGHTLNLRDAEITSLIATVSEITGRNFIIDPRVSGKVNVISNRPMNADEVYDVFLSVLRVNGFAAVGAGNIIKIVPEALASQDAPAAPGSSAPDALVTRIVPVNHLSPAELVQLLRPLVPQSAQLLPHPTSSTLLIADRAANVDRIQALIARLDQASATEVEVVPLQHANAAEVVRTLSLLQPNGASDGSANKLAADERTNSILIAGDRGKRLRLKALIAHLDTPLSGSETLQVIYLRYADAEQLVPILETALATFGGRPADGEGDSKPAIQAHQETNSLVINAPPAVFRDLKEVVRQLDIRRAQVLIEALIAEVSDNIAREIGVQWQATNDDFNGSGLIGGTNFPSGGGIINATLNPGALAGQAGLNLGYVRGTVAIPGLDGEFLQLGALVRALAADTASNVLSTPSTMTLDHQEATLSVGQEVPFLTGQYASTGTTTTTGGQSGVVNPFQTIDRKEVGLKLRVTPHINEGDSVVLDIDLEVSSLAPSNQQGAAVDLITNTRKLTTRVLVRDRAMLVLGGLTSEQLTDSVQKVPGLGSIPVVGNLFKYRSSNKERRSLMIFLTPSIARDSATEALISSEKYNYLRTEQLRAREQNSGLLPDEVTPLLPEMQDFLRQGLPQGEPMAGGGAEGQR